MEGTWFREVLSLVVISAFTLGMVVVFRQKARDAFIAESADDQKDPEITLFLKRLSRTKGRAAKQDLRDSQAKYFHYHRVSNFWLVLFVIIFAGLWYVLLFR